MRWAAGTSRPRRDAVPHTAGSEAPGPACGRPTEAERLCRKLFARRAADGYRWAPFTAMRLDGRQLGVRGGVMPGSEPRRRYYFCAVCGDSMPDAPTADYVHEQCLAKAKASAA